MFSFYCVLQSQIEEMKRKNYQRKNFVSQSSRLVTQYPEYKDEILDCVSQLNTKWDQLTQTMSPKRNISGDCFNLGIGKAIKNSFSKKLTTFNRHLIYVVLVESVFVI